MNVAIIVAGGAGKRLGLGFNKAFALLEGVPLICYAISNFERCAEIDAIVVCAGNDEDGSGEHDVRRVRELLAEYHFRKVERVVVGAPTRMQSVGKGLAAAELNDADLVLIQDASRPFCAPALVTRLLAEAREHGAAICGTPPKDTVQQIDERGMVTDTFDRSRLIAIATPAVAEWKLLREARAKAIAGSYLDTPGFEDSALLQKSGAAVKCVQTDYTNIKITTEEDLEIARVLLEKYPELRFSKKA